MFLLCKLLLIVIFFQEFEKKFKDIDLNELRELSAEDVQRDYECSMECARFALRRLRAQQDQREREDRQWEREDRQWQLEERALNWKQTKADLLDSKLAPLDYEPSPSSSSRAALRQIPTSVKKWQGLEHKVARFRNTLSADVLEKRVNFYLQPNTQRAHQESEVCSAMAYVIGPAIPKIFDETVHMVTTSGCPIVTTAGQQGADFLCYTVDDEESRILAPIEIRFCDLSDQGTDLVKRKSTGYVMDALQQATGYHAHYKCRFAFLSTFLWTWATRLDPDGSLFVSNAWDSQAQGENSVFNLFHYILTQAKERGNSGEKWRCPLLEDVRVSKDAEQDESRGKSGRRKRDRSPAKSASESKKKRIKGAKSLQCNLICITAVKKDRITWQAEINGSSDRLVAVKGFIYQNDRDVEVECYNALKHLQGVSIPKLFCANYWLDDDSGRNHALVLSWVGSKSGGSRRMLPTDALKIARTILKEIHRCGVVHCDFRPDNMIYDFKTRTLFVYDFGDASTVRRLGSAAFKEACDRELERLDELIKWSQSEEGRKLQYMH